MEPEDHSPDDGGFSLVEIMVAIMIFAILMLGLIPVFVQSLSLTSTSASVTTGSRVANAQVEAARTLQIAIGDTPRCARFQDALAIELAKGDDERHVLVLTADDGRSSVPLTVEHTATCDPTDDRAVLYNVVVKQGSKVLADTATEFWISEHSE